MKIMFHTLLLILLLSVIAVIKLFVRAPNSSYLSKHIYIPHTVISTIGLMTVKRPVLPA